MTSILKYLNRALLVLLLAAFAACSDNEGGNESNGNGDDGNTETPADGDTYGYIKDTNGNPVEGVVVSDGYSCTATDAEGRYALTRNADAGFVFYSLPSAYKVSVDKTYKLPRFFARLQAGTARYDFTLEALAAPEKRFDLICIGDPQINEASHAVRFKEEAGREIREYAASAGVPCYGITLGDHVNNKWTLFTNMVVALQPEQTGVPVFATIGNHDHEFPTADEKAARAKYESYFGPVDYSFNRGDVHVVSMDNVIHSCKASADYEGGFTAAQYAWLKQDLSFVPKDKMVILCVHIPFRGGWGTNSAHADADKYYDEVLDLLSQYEYAAIMSAHTHSNINYIHRKNGKEIFEHVTGTTCGAWWRSTVCTEGTPIGFGLYRIDGNRMEEWAYRSVRHDEQFQIRLYRASDTFVGGAKYRFKQTGADQIVANIWNWDPSWTVNVYENDVLSGQMTRNSDIDAWTVAYHIGLLNNTDSYRKSSDHMFHYTLKNPAAAVRVEAIDRFGNKYEQTVFTDPAEHPALPALPLWAISLWLSLGHSSALPVPGLSSRPSARSCPRASSAPSIWRSTALWTRSSPAVRCARPSPSCWPCIERGFSTDEQLNCRPAGEDRPYAGPSRHHGLCPQPVYRRVCLSGRPAVPGRSQHLRSHRPLSRKTGHRHRPPEGTQL